MLLMKIQIIMKKLINSLNYLLLLLLKIPIDVIKYLLSTIVELLDTITKLIENLMFKIQR